MLNKTRIKQSFSNSAKEYDRFAVLQQEVMKKLFNLLAPQAKQILDVGSGTGTLVGLMAKKYAAAKIIGLDLAPGMIELSKSKVKTPNVSFLQGDGEALPFADQQFDLVVSSLALQWMEPKRAFAEAARVLKPGGSFIFSTFGPATLAELKKTGLSINYFPGKVELVGLLAGHFSRAEIDSSIIVKEYKDVFELFLYLKEIGAQTPSKVKAKGLLTRTKLARSFGRQGLSVNYEIYYGRCLKVD